MLNFTNYQGNAIKTWWDITTSHLLEWLLLRRQKITGVGEDVEKKEPLFTDGWCSLTQSCLTLWPHGLQHASLPCPSPSPEAYSSSCPSISDAIHLVLCRLLLLLPSIFPRVGSLHQWPKYWSFSFSTVLPMSIQDWFPLELTGRNVNWGSHYGKQSRGSSKS